MTHRGVVEVDVPGEGRGKRGPAQIREHELSSKRIHLSEAVDGGAKDTHQRSDVDGGGLQVMGLEEQGAPCQVHGKLSGVQAQWDGASA